MILFKKISWKNFLSTGNHMINVDLNENSTNQKEKQDLHIYAKELLMK